MLYLMGSPNYGEPFGPVWTQIHSVELASSWSVSRGEVRKAEFGSTVPMLGISLKTRQIASLVA